ncbi:MAG: Tex family protein [Deltaproteobacteria bacterium]|nr:Tex family protein [Deltaproteobacteria bacterium]
MPSPLTFQEWFRTQHPQIPLQGAQAIISLAEGGATVPFIARYRKEQTGNLDEVAVRQVLESNERWDALTKRQTFIVEEITRQGKNTPELEARIRSTFDETALEDLYLPYKQKRKTKAQTAREAGLAPLTDWLWARGHGKAAEPDLAPEVFALTFVDSEKGIADAQAALAGAAEIVIERLSESPSLRQTVRESFMEKGCCRTRKSDKAKTPSRFENYFDYQESVKELLKPQSSHRYLAMRRGWMEEELSLSLGGRLEEDSKDDPLLDALLVEFEKAACPDASFVGAPMLKRAARMALRAYVAPSIENEVHKALREIADTAAIVVFAENVRKLLLAAPFGSKAVLGVDPGLRTGCKLAIVEDSGKYLGSGVIHLETPSGRGSASAVLVELVKKGNIRAVAIGNGTAGRETETFVREALRNGSVEVPVVMVSEAGASVYSASDTARDEFPDLDLTIRGAISIARRLQDPLAELVKIDPKSIGVGQYQHDVSPTALKKSLDEVVDSCVNQVGVNLNTASHHLLAHVSGIGPGLARGIVDHRNKVGLFRSRTQLLDVSRFTKKAFEQAAGFLRIPDAEHPLDNTGVHPERYDALERLAARLGVPAAGLLGTVGVKRVKEAGELKDELGAFTFEDIIKELEKPGRDPRDGFVPFTFRADIHKLEDLQPGMMCPGIVTNVTNFGAFVDIGVHQDGLVHISQLSDKFVKDPAEVVSAGDRVTVRVIEIKLDRKQIALSMKAERSASESQPRQGNTAQSPGGQRDNRPAVRPSAPTPAAPFNNPFAALGQKNR